MINEFKVENKIIRIYCTNVSKDKLPLIVLNHYDDNTDLVFNECLKINTRDFILVTISSLDWDNDMTPYYSSKIYKGGNDYLGNADEYIKLLENIIIPKVKEYIYNNFKIQIEYLSIVGYSLGGLFALYSIYKTTLFTKVASVSGSFWYPNIINFIKENEILGNVNEIYFSLGNMESKTKNEVLMLVESNTKEIEHFYENKGIVSIYEENEGNHFKECNLRVAKAIKWLLGDK